VVLSTKFVGGDLMHDLYESPLTKRYASTDMSFIFSEQNKFTTWRRLWVALAEAEKELGLNITQEQIDELKMNINNINYDEAEKREKTTRHDVMSHVYAYGLQCPNAKGIIHLGATSCYVGDNTDIIIMKQGLLLIRKKLIQVIKNLKKFALDYKDMPALAFTHLQPAQLTTVGKRACLWIQDLVSDIGYIDYTIDSLKMLGVKGTTGTQASFLSLFDGDSEKVKKLDSILCEKMGFESKYYLVTGQTYPRKQDMHVLNCLASIAQSAYKFSNDMRLLQSMKEIEEPFEETQIGSSAMAYKRNPMRSERISSLSRYVIINSLNPAITASTQWLERTLDDSANKRISTAEGFLTLDGILNIYINITSGLVVYPKIIEKHIYEELPFMATENILMESVKMGGDRQELHEKIRIHSMEAARIVKEQGGTNDLIDRICSDPIFNLSKEEVTKVLKPENYTGRASEQVEEFIREEVEPILESNSCEDLKIELNV
jgi:adenylosuccinate lyase